MPHTNRLALPLACALLVVVGVALRPTAQASADSAVPYNDPNAHGVIGLCDRNGNTIDHGKITDRPFVWAAIGSEAAPTDYAIDGRTATLFGFQPREAHEPGEFSGQMLTASSRYDNAAHPKAQATDGDYTLAELLDIYPAKLRGLVQLRLYLGAPGEPTLGTSYAATDIQVTGDTWKVVRGGSVPCNASNAISIEDIYKTAPTTTVPAAVPVAGSGAATGDAAAVPASSVPAAGGAASSTTVTEPSDEVTRPVAAGDTTVSTDSDRTPIVAIALAVLIAGIIAALVVWRRRSSGGSDELGPDAYDPDPFGPAAEPAADADAEAQHVAADSPH